MTSTDNGPNTPTPQASRPGPERATPILDRPWARILFTVVVTVLGAVAVSWARSAPGDRITSASYEVPSSVVASAAGQASSASFVLDGTAGQPGSVPFRMIGDTYQVTSGFWSFAETGSYWLFWNRFESGDTSGWSAETP